jgi:hypothetical protein
MKIETLIKTVVVFFLLFPHVAHAGNVRGGNVVGNGGVFVKCDRHGDGENDSVSYELLDFVDDPSSEFINIDESLTFATDIEIARAVLYRLNRIDKTRAARYRYWLEKFYRETSFVDYVLPRTMDAGLIWELQGGCQLVQGAIQVAPEKEGDFRYFINRSIWSQASPLNRAGMIIHELAVRDARQQGLETTQRLRKFVAFLFSKQLLLISNQQYLDQLELSGMSASILSPALLSCKQVISSLLIDRKIVSAFSKQSRYFGNESATGVRTIYFGNSLQIEGSQLKLPLLLTSNANIFSKSTAQLGPVNFLRGHEHSINFLLKVFQKRSSDLVFASLESYLDDQVSAAVSLQGVAKCNTTSMAFDWVDVGFVDYEIETNNSVLSTSRYLVEWLNNGGILEEKADITTWQVDPTSLEKGAILSKGWPL